MLQIQYRDVATLVPYARNAKKHDAANVEQIARIIKQFGFLDPVAVDTDGVIVWGHGRVLAAQKLGMDTVPVIELPRTLTPEQIRALRLTHNKLAEKSGWDFDALKIELGALNTVEFDLNFTAFEGFEVDNLLRDVDSFFVQPVKPQPTAIEADEADDVSDWDDETEADTNENQSEDEDEDEDDYTPTPAKKASDDDYAEFSLIMLHANKVKLVEVLNVIKQKYGLDNPEDAIMEMVRFYEAEKYTKHIGC